MVHTRPPIFVHSGLMSGHKMSLWSQWWPTKQKEMQTSLLFCAQNRRYQKKFGSFIAFPAHCEEKEVIKDSYLNLA